MDTPPNERFKHKKSLGQNFLTSTVVPGWLTEAGDVKSGELIYEIGPGTGRLTETLLSAGAQVVAVEADERAVAHLHTVFSNAVQTGQLTIHHGDAKVITPETLGLKNGQFKTVANIPYYLSGLLLRQQLSGEVQPKTLIFLMQKELVERIARVKKESLLSLSVKAFGNPYYYKTVSRGHFNPKPNVDSAILVVKNISKEHFETLSPEFFFTVLHLGLGKKRKQLLTNLSKRWLRPELTKIFTSLKLDLTVRGEDIPLNTWLALAEKLQPIN